MSGRSIVALVFGSLGILVGAALLSGALWIITEDREDGFFVTDPHTFEQMSNAIVSTDIDILTDAPGWVIDLVADPVDLRISAAADDVGVFAGIGPTSDVDAYLAGVAHHEVTDVDFDGARITDVGYELHEGIATPGRPRVQEFWVASSEGLADAPLDWPLDSGNWTAVIMNDDGSAGVHADLTFGVKVANIVAVAWIVLGFAIASILGGLLLAYFALRTTRGGVESEAAAPVTEPEADDAPDDDDVEPSDREPVTSAPTNVGCE